MTGINRIEANDLVQLQGFEGKTKIIKLIKGQSHQSQDGVINHDEIIGLNWGETIASHMGKRFFCLRPALDDLLRSVNRKTQTLYPKDMAYILLSMGIGPGDEIVEIGTGSGAMTIAMAHSVGTSGKVFTYERRPEIQQTAIENVERLGYSQQVEFVLRDVVDGISQSNQRALFVDMPDPEMYVEQFKECLQIGGFFACILPTTNQVSALLLVLKRNGFALFEVSEILHRYYKPVARRLRPADSMVAHTGFLVFARHVDENELKDEL
jgi:tRNA (adenine57-N1/adenine58-N1)-methyltransferase